MTRIHLFIPYYLSEDHDRQEELDRCLAKNVEVAGIDRIFLLVDDGHMPPVRHDKITVLKTSGRPSYGTWLDLTRQHSAEAISVLANSGIYLDETVTQLAAIFTEQPQAFVAISRHEIAGEAAALHENPHWSQDVWAVDGRRPLPAALRSRLDIPLGVPRCHNRIGYLFSIHGYDIFNPCNFVRACHLHETQLREDAPLDMPVLGGTAWIYPSETLTQKSELTFDILTQQAEPVAKAQVSTTAFRPQRLSSAPRSDQSDCIVAYDANWQFPAITEQYAYMRLRETLALRQNEGRVIYFAYPWATLIDNLLHNRKTPEKTEFLKQKLLSFIPRLRGARTVVTACQHIDMLKFQGLFRDLGITDIFWSHAVKGQTVLPSHPDIRLHPFPLYPVQAKDFVIDPAQPKKHLFSFMGAKANQYYLTEARNIIIEELKTAGGFVVGNETWHYNKVVYDHQVRGLAKTPDALVDTEQSEAFRRVLAQSVFSLCPSGTGPNSIRLWESIGLGAIPVIMADTLALPGNPALWQEAAVFCAEDRASILALPQRLKAIHADPALLKRKRHAMAQIWDLYGIDGFVYDIRKLMMERYQEARIDPGPAKAIPEAAMGSGGSSLNAITTEILLSPATAAPKLRDERDRILDLLARASASQQAIFARALASRDLTTAWEA